MDPPLDAVEGVWIDESCGVAHDEPAFYCCPKISDEDYFAIASELTAAWGEGPPSGSYGEESFLSWDGIVLEWQDIHERLVHLAADRARLDAEEARWLLAGLRAEVHRKVGYGSFLEYLERVFGYGPRFAIERIRVARALEVLPVLLGSLEEGGVSWSAVRELTRVVVPETEAEWLNAVSGKTVREVERMVSGLEPGDRPGDVPKERARRHVLRFEVAAETYAAFREAERMIVEELGTRPDDDAMLLGLARRVLQGPGDAGRSGYQVALTICAHCEQGWIDGGGDPVAVGSEVVEMASCDAVEVGWAGQGEPPVGEGSEAVAPEAAGGMATPGTDSGSESAESTHVGTDEGPGSSRKTSEACNTTRKRGRRARQEIPPSVRRAIYRRDRGRCSVPGCRCTVFLDAHHPKALAEGGSNDPDNICLLCGNHHRAVHRGMLIIEGRPSTVLRFLHADGTGYGGAVSAPEADLKVKAFRGLRGLGLTESEARNALSRTHVGTESTVEELIKEALRVYRLGGLAQRVA